MSEPAPSKVKETEKEVFIEGIPRMRFGEGMDCSFIRSVQLALGAIGEPHSYDFLMGISGACFRIHFHPDWCPSSGDVTAGFDVSRPLFRHLGYGAEMVAIDDNKFTDIRSFYGRIVAQIDRGIPVIAINLKVCPEWGIITGYLKERPGLLCRTFFDEADAYSRANRAPWLSLFLNGQQEPQVPRGESPERSLQQAIHLADTDQFGEYASGFSAYEYWIGELEDLDGISDRKRFGEIIGVNRMLLNLLCDARRSAYRFLGGIGIRDQIPRGGEIADRYDALGTLLEEAIANRLPHAGEQPAKWSGADAGIWSGKILERQIALLTEVMELEREAIGLIRLAVPDIYS